MQMVRAELLLLYKSELHHVPVVYRHCIDHTFQCVVYRPNFFILDEPTNHLDMETIEALGKAINNFKVGQPLLSV